MAVEGVELCWPGSAWTRREAIAQVVAVAVEEALLLDEVDEHQAVEHHRGVPLESRPSCEPCDEAEERRRARFEAVVECVTRSTSKAARTRRHVDDGEVRLLVGGSEGVELLDQRLAGLAAAEEDAHARGWPSGSSPDPLPDLLGRRRSGDDQVLVDDFELRLLDLAGSASGGRSRAARNATIPRFSATPRGGDDSPSTATSTAR